MAVLKILMEEQLLIKYYAIEHFILIKIQNIMDINVALLQRFINFVKKTSGGIAKNENVSNKGLSELHKPIITKFKKRKLHPPFIDNIQAQMCN